MTGRAIRRHHHERIRHRVEHYYGGVHRGNMRRIGVLVHTPTPCSCWMCGNPRRYWNQKSLAEQRADEAWRRQW